MAPFNRRKQEKPARQQSYERVRKDYRRALNSFTASVMVAVLVAITVTPLIGSAAVGSSQVFTGPVDTRYGTPMLPLKAYGVDLNDRALDDEPLGLPAEQEAAKAAADGDRGFLGFNEPPVQPAVREVRSEADAKRWEISPRNSSSPGVNVYMSPGFMVFGVDPAGGIRVFQEGDIPFYAAIARLGLDGEQNLNSKAILEKVKRNEVGSNILDGDNSTMLPYRLVFSVEKSSGLAKAQMAGIPTAGGKAPAYSLYNSEIISPVYTNEEAYVYISPQSAYEQYLALKGEYSRFRSDYDSDPKDPENMVTSGIYLAQIMILENYLNETLAQDGTRGWAGFNLKSWESASSSLGVAAAAIRADELKFMKGINNTMRASAQGSDRPLTFNELKDLDTIFHPAGTSEGIFTPPTYPIQMQSMPGPGSAANEEQYRLQVINSVSTDELATSVTQADANGMTSLLDGVRQFVTGTDLGTAAISERLLNSSLGSGDVPVIMYALSRIPNGYYLTKNRFYSPLKAGTGSEIYLTRVSLARTVVTPGFIFQGYTPTGGVKGSSVDGSTADNPRNATSCMFFSAPSFAPALAQRMADKTNYNGMNTEYYGLYSNELLSKMAAATLEAKLPGFLGDIAGAVTDFWGKAPAGLADSMGFSPAAEAAAVWSKLKGTGNVNKLGWAYSPSYSENDKAMTATAGTGATALSEEEGGIEGERAYTGVRAPYTVDATLQRRVMLSAAGTAIPYPDAVQGLRDASAKQMYQQGYHLDVALAELGSAFSIASPDVVFGRVIAATATSMLRGATQLFKFAFGSSLSFSNGDIGNPMSWKNPFDILVSPDGLGGVYSTLQTFGLLLVAIFIFWLGFATVLGGTDDGVFPISFGTQADLKSAIPKTFIAVIMIGLPAYMTAGGKLFAGGGYWIASFVLQANDVICSLFSIQVTDQFLANLTNISSMAGESTVSALVYSLIAFVMAGALFLGSCMLLLRTLCLYLFVLCSPLVWAFWVLGSKGDGVEMFKSRGGEIPKAWLKGFTQLVFVQVFWLFAFFIVSSLFTSPELTANIFGLKAAGAASTSGLGNAQAAIPIYTGAVNSLDLFVRGILVVVVFFIMAKIAKPFFKGSWISGLDAVTKSADSLREAVTKPAKDKFAQASGLGTKAVERATNAALHPVQTGQEGIRKAREAASKAGDIAGKANGFKNMTKEQRLDAIKKAATNTGQQVKDKAQLMAADKASRLGEKIGGGPKALAAGSVASNADANLIDSSYAAAERRAAESAGDKWRGMNSLQRHAETLKAMPDQLAGAIGKDENGNAVGYRILNSDEELAAAGLQDDGSFIGSEDNRRAVAATLRMREMRDAVTGTLDQDVEAVQAANAGVSELLGKVATVEEVVRGHQEATDNVAMMTEMLAGKRAATTLGKLDKPTRQYLENAIPGLTEETTVEGIREAIRSAMPDAEYAAKCERAVAAGMANARASTGECIELLTSALGSAGGLNSVTQEYLMKSAAPALAAVGTAAYLKATDTSDLRSRLAAEYGNSDYAAGLVARLAAAAVSGKPEDLITEARKLRASAPDAAAAEFADKLAEQAVSMMEAESRKYAKELGGVHEVSGLKGLLSGYAETGGTPLLSALTDVIKSATANLATEVSAASLPLGGKRSTGQTRQALPGEGEQRSLPGGEG